MFGGGREALPYVREWSGGPPGCPIVVVRPSRLSVCGREALLDVQECLGGLTGGWETHPDVRG